MWFWLAIGSAVIAALTLTLNKKALKNSSPALVAWSLFAFNTPLVALIALKMGPTKVNQWFFVGALGSATIFSIAKTLSLSAIKKSVLSKLAPLNTFNAAFTYLLALVFLGEILQIKAITGLGLITLGAYVLKTKSIKDKWLQPFKSLVNDKSAMIFLLAIFLSSITAIFDKLSIVNTNPANPALSLLMENLTVTVILWFYLNKKEPGWKIEFKNNYKLLVFMSLLYGMGNVLIFSGFALGPVALVIGIKQLQLLLVLILGYLMLKDKPSKQSVWASVIMILGAILIKLA